MGKAAVSTMLSMVREIVFGVGFALLLPIFFGLDGVLYSMPLSDILTALISGNTVYNSNVSANMLKSKFYVCPICGNVIHSTGEAVIHCHGVLLTAEEPEEANQNHQIYIEQIEDEYFVRIEHSMSKSHYISFIAALSSDRIQTVKLYPEGNAETRFKISGVKRILSYCNKDGLFYVDLTKKQK